MTVKTPSLSQLRAIVGELGLDMTDAQIGEYRDAMAPGFDLLDWLQSEPEAMPPIRYPRTPGHEPVGEQNPFNGWARRTSIPGASSGPLYGRTVAIKDNIAVAGVPMTNGASTLAGYTPDFDATVVTRILDAGGEIAGKAHCEFFSFTGNSHSNWKRAKVQNPFRAGRTPGGSSSGCGALVGGGAVDMAIGGDQGGSIRIPSAWCGCYGLKPTHGLVPYTGATPLEMTLDHLGPMTRNVADNARLLEAIAGPDGLDPRQREVQVKGYVEALGRPVKGLRIGVLKEGFGHANADPQVEAKVRGAIERLGRLGATLVEVSMPCHLDATAIWLPIAYQGAVDLVMHGNGLGSNWMGLYPRSLGEAHAAWRMKQHEFSETLKFVMIIGHYLKTVNRGDLYARAQNRRRQYIADYSRVFREVDAIAYPTTPFVAPGIPGPGCSMLENLEASGGMANNTLAANLTQHPVMSLPCGLNDEGLPIGLSLSAAAWQEPTLYTLAHAFEQHADWRSL